MQLKQLIADDDAVSPVIGVILMVAITVILAAVIATFVLGLGEQISDSAPQATFEFEYDSNDDQDNLTITHSGGQTITASNLHVRGSSVEDDGSWDSIRPSLYDSGSSIGTGAWVGVDVESDDTVSVVWETSDGGQSAPLQQWQGPDA